MPSSSLLRRRRTRWACSCAEVPSCRWSALIAVAVVGLVGGIRYLRDALSPVAVLGRFYVMLAAVALSITMEPYGH